jgi:ribonuclease Y
MLTTWILPSTLGLLFGGALAWMLSNYLGTLEKKRAQAEAKELLDRAKDAAELIEMDQKELLLEIEEELWTKAEPELFKTEESIEELEERIEEMKEKVTAEGKELKKSLEPKQAELNDLEKKLRENESKVQSLRSDLNKHVDACVTQLAKRLNSSRDLFVKELIQEMVNETQVRCLKENAEYLADVSNTVEQRAKRLLAIAIDRFARPYCSERGLGSVEFPDNHVRQLFLDKDKKNLTLVQEICGCDLIVEDDSETIGIAGFDPVRREWTRRSIEKILKERRAINADLIRRKTADAKRELVRQIKQDGDNIARELGLRDLHPEIRQMMGSLRYRYSFTQNQHFHCAEVGWLCGLLAGELKLPIRLARRAGMLHDIGKSMDHAMEGGHAVIGADFIKERNEAPEIVHAVRSHHFDEQPNSDLAFLVIAADAISGARPGARRSALESYTQKVTELETIALSFPGIDDCYVLSGGREVRVIANEEQLDDVKALALSKELAARIENEVNYPGQIKVVVVRNTLIQETTRI